MKVPPLQTTWVSGRQEFRDHALSLTIDIKLINFTIAGAIAKDD